MEDFEGMLDWTWLTGALSKQTRIDEQMDVLGG
jgi:hypothetical protein